MNTEIIRGNALQAIELVEEVTRLTNEVRYAQYDKEQKDQRITALENEKEELNKRCERLNADSMAYCNYGKEIEKKKNAEIKALQEEKEKIIEGAKKNQEEESFMTRKCIDAMKEANRFKGLLARNGIKYKKVK